jgi:formylglycine-generating enzyme required for sulfatase activity
MKLIPGGIYNFYSYNDDNFIPYPSNDDTSVLDIGPFYIDEYPVTNRDFAEFLNETGYSPNDTSAFLAHWIKGTYTEDMANHPVVYISYGDAKAYAEWAGKRLPTEPEWQYAAQGKDGRLWPWGDEFDSLRCNNNIGHTTTVYSYPEGESPFGVKDLTGNVWQMTSDIYFNGSYYYQILKGGSYYKPTSSWWYIDGGPQPVNWQQMLLLTGSGMSRNATVGFRCVKDIKRD